MLRALGRLIGASASIMPARLARPLLRRINPFDLRHGTDTGGLLYAPDLPTGHEHDACNEGYYATAPSVFRGLISRWEDTLGAPDASRLGTWDSTPRDAPEKEFLNLSHYHFIDLGCGKGRVLLLASQLPFRAVTGIELHAGLCATASRNVRISQRQRPGAPIQVICGDVLDLPLPDGPVVLFLFNSFGADVMRRLLEKLSAAAEGRSAPIDLLYVHPDWVQMVESAPGVAMLFRGDIPFSREDELADAFGVSVDHCAAYRFGA